MAKLSDVYVNSEKRLLTANQVILKDSMSLQGKLDNNLIGCDIKQASELIMKRYDEVHGLEQNGEIANINETDTANIAINKLEEKLIILNRIVKYLQDTNQLQ